MRGITHENTEFHVSIAAYVQYINLHIKNFYPCAQS